MSETVPAAAASAGSATPATDATRGDDAAAGAAGAAGAATSWQPTAAEMEELVRMIDDDLRKNPSLSDSERRRRPEQLAPEFVEAHRAMLAENVRNRVIEKQLTDKYGTPADIKARRCEEMRAELRVLQGGLDGKSTEIMTDAERAELPETARQLRDHLASTCS